MNILNHVPQVLATASMQVVLGNQSAVSLATEINPHGAHPQISQFAGRSHHVGRCVTATQTVHQNGYTISGFPSLRKVVVNDQAILIGQTDHLATGHFSICLPAEKQGSDRLDVGVPHEP
jgi:hypothetical protein